MKKFITFIIALTLTSCKGGYKNNFELVSLTDKSNIMSINPSSMLQASAERITFSSSNVESVEKITEWVHSKHPTRAEISCKAHEEHCLNIEKLLHSFSLPMKHVIGHTNGINDVTLVYEKLEAHDCYESLQSIAPSSHDAVAHPPFGCAVNRNIIEMVSDHHQFINPKLSGMQDASKFTKALKEVD
jgi:hypothetical protein